MIKGSLHEGSLYIFDTQTAGHQCIPNCIVAAAYASIVPVSKWTGESLNCILHCGDALYKKLKEIMIFCKFMKLAKKFMFLIKLPKSSLKMNTMEQTTTVGTTLEKVITMYHSLSQSKQHVYDVLCSGDHHGSSATLLHLPKSNIYIFLIHIV